MHQDRLQFWLNADGAQCWELPDSEEESQDYNADGSDDLDLPERLRPSVAEMCSVHAARRATLSLFETVQRSCRHSCA